MERVRIKRGQIAYFSDLQCKLAYNQHELSPFISQPFSKEAVLNQIEGRATHYPNQNRKYLVDVIRSQYGELSGDISSQLDLLLESNTFTVTTGHQLNLLTGPLYFIYKIVHAIKLAQELKESYPMYNFVPIYWMASEDHDFEEINHFNLFGKKIEWYTAQQGPVGLFDLDNWSSWQDELRTLFPNNLPQLDELFSVYKGANLADATRNLVHHLFGQYGLVILDATHPELKKLFRKTMAKEIMTNFSEKLVKETSSKLITAGIKPQVNPRPINLFFIEKGKRERLVLEEGRISIPTLGSFSPLELIDLIDSRPELFSPNVVLRPLYQETILPNIVFVGGGGELAYWLQLKGVFEEIGQPFPLLNLRNSFQLIEKSHRDKLAKLSLSFEQLSDELEAIQKRYVLEHTANEIDFSDINLMLDEIESNLKQKATLIDQTLGPMIGSEMSRIGKVLESIKGRLVKAEKQKFAQELGQIENLKHKLFPNNGLQERELNFLPFYLQFGDEFIRTLIDLSEPFNGDFQSVSID